MPLLPETLTVLANAACPHCVHAVDMLTDLAVLEGVPIAAIDVAAHPDVAARWSAECSPFLIVESAQAPPRTYAGIPDAFEFHQLLAPP